MGYFLHIGIGGALGCRIWYLQLTLEKEKLVRNTPIFKQKCWWIKQGLLWKRHWCPKICMLFGSLLMQCELMLPFKHRCRLLCRCWYQPGAPSFDSLWFSQKNIFHTFLVSPPEYFFLTNIELFVWGQTSGRRTCHWTLNVLFTADLRSVWWSLSSVAKKNGV